MVFKSAGMLGQFVWQK